MFKNRLKSYNSPTFLAYALIAPAAIYILMYSCLAII